MKRFLLTLTMVLSALTLFAQDVKFDVAAPGAVQMGELFRVEFSLNAKPDKFNAPEFEGLDVMAGPSTSSSRSTSIVNGSITKSVNYTYTYVVQANNEGTATVQSASVVVDGKTYSTSPVTIAVVDESSTESASSAQGGGDAQTVAPTNKIGKNDLFIVVHLDKTKAYKGEPIRATLKLYTRV
jgi:hypothetical protein